jgi:hypothetical protein
MNTSALLMMLAANLFIAGVTGFFFWKVLSTPPPAPDPAQTDEIEYPRGG